MLEAFLVTFREGIEAFLIIAITLAFLKRAGRKDACVAVYYGIGGSILLSAILGVFLVSISSNPLTEGVLALIAGVLVATLTYNMMVSGKKMKGIIEQNVSKELKKTSLATLFGIFMFTTLMITREGMETVLFISAIVGENSALSLFTGATAGVAAAAGLGFLWIKYQSKINLGKFMQVTAVFLMLFCVQLFLYGIHELSEINALPLVDNILIHDSTEAFAEDGIFALMLSYGLIAAPVLWLLGIWLYKRPEHYNPAE